MVIAAARKSHPALVVYLWLAITGARSGELGGLLWADIGLTDAGVLFIAFGYIVRGGPHVRKNTKTHQGRCQGIDQVTCAMLNELKQQAEYALADVGVTLPYCLRVLQRSNRSRRSVPGRELRISSWVSGQGRTVALALSGGALTHCPSVRACLRMKPTRHRQRGIAWEDATEVDLAFTRHRHRAAVRPESVNHEPDMDLGLIVSIVAAAAAVASVVIGIWQGWIALHPEPPTPPPPPEDPQKWANKGTTATVPVDLLPANVRGRTDFLGKLQRQLREGGLVVLAGTGGMGKSTIARELARRMRPGPPRWEVSGLTREELTAGLITVARDLKASEVELENIGTPNSSGPECLWKLLNAGPKGWLLIVDNADNPEYLAAPKAHDAERPRLADGRGWARTSQRGLMLVTSRDSGEARDEDVWPARAILLRVERLSDPDAARILLDLAPEAGQENQALALARRLGGLPLVLHLAGRYLNSKYVDHATFDAFRQALESDPRVIRRLNRGDPAGAERVMVMVTWELSLNALAKRGKPQARPLLRLLSCFAPGRPIPLSLLKADLLDPLLHSSVEPDGGSKVGPHVDQLLEGLGSLGLIDAVRLGTKKALLVHPVIADTNRIHLLEPGHSDPSPILVRGTAVDLLAAALDDLIDDRPADWQAFRELTSHLQAMLDIATPARNEGGVSRFDQKHLDTLIRIAGHAAMAHGKMGLPEFGIELVTPGLAIGMRAGENLTPTILLARQQQAYLLSRAGREAEAESIYRQVLQAQLSMRPKEDLANLAARYNLASSIAARGDFEGAEADFREILDDARRALGDKDRYTLAAREALATLLCQKGAWVQAERELHHLCQDALQAPGTNVRSTLAIRFNLIQAVRHQEGRGNDAEADARDLLRDAELELGKDHPLTVTIREFHEGVLIRNYFFQTPTVPRMAE